MTLNRGRQVVLICARCRRPLKEEDGKIMARQGQNGSLDRICRACHSDSALGGDEIWKIDDDNRLRQ